MVNQKAISARINVNTLWEIEQETMTGSTNRNELLNNGAKLYLDLLDAKRTYRCIPDIEVRSKILKGFLKKWWPEAAGIEI